MRCRTTYSQAPQQHADGEHTRKALSARLCRRSSDRIAPQPFQTHQPAHHLPHPHAWRPLLRTHRASLLTRSARTHSTTQHLRTKRTENHLSAADRLLLCRLTLQHQPHRDRSQAASTHLRGPQRRGTFAAPLPPHTLLWLSL